MPFIVWVWHSRNETEGHTIHPAWMCQGFHPSSTKAIINIRLRLSHRERGHSTVYNIYLILASIIFSANSSLLPYSMTCILLRDDMFRITVYWTKAEGHDYRQKFRQRWNCALLCPRLTSLRTCWIKSRGFTRLYYWQDGYNAGISRMWKAPNHRHFWFLQCPCRQRYNMITNHIHIFFNVQKELYNH